ncbi:RAD52 motif-containing 1 [Labeo rohita]|uniref:RAD52 motif-containing 1 n=1 Tax=Labeo rohita TaxID=84645 RepID=A0A498MWJ5_LABRO|nr:RAD52 motif-containing 1 [Labeo rohita]
MVPPKQRSRSCPKKRNMRRLENCDVRPVESESGWDGDDNLLPEDRRLLSKTIPMSFCISDYIEAPTGKDEAQRSSVCPNATVAEPGFYALVKFYSSAQASKAQRATDKQCLFQSSPLKVRLSTKQNLSFYSSKPLSLSKCQNLANHYLGFGGWSTRIVTLKDISNCVDAGCQEETDDQSVLLKYGCIAELTFPQHRMSCQGVGVAEEIIDNDRGEFTYTLGLRH